MEYTDYLSDDRPNISPRAYMLALHNNIDILSIVPSGPRGRIIENDILRAIENRNRPQDVPAETEVSAEGIPVPPAVEEAPAEELAEEVSEEPAEVPADEPVLEEDVPAEPLTEEAAEDMPAPEEAHEETAIVAAPVITVVSEDTETPAEEQARPEEKPFAAEDVYRHADVIIPHSEEAPDASPITLEMSFDATALVTLRQKIKEHGEAMNLPAVTLNDMILFATAKTLKKHKAMNAHFLEDKIRYFDGVHLSFAVDTERGPKTLTVFDADRLSLSSLSKIAGTLVRGIRAGGETPEKNLRKGSFSVTNVGTLGVERFTPRLTAPQTGALAVCALTKRIKTVNGADTVYPCIPLALTFDPRAMGTANAAKFLRDLCLALENFGLLLIK